MPRRPPVALIACLLPAVLAGCSKEPPPPPNLVPIPDILATQGKKHHGATAKPAKKPGKEQAGAKAAGDDATDKAANKGGASKAAGGKSGSGAAASESLESANKTCRDNAEDRRIGSLATLFGFRKSDPNADYLDCMREKGYQPKE